MKHLLLILFLAACTAPANMDAAVRGARLLTEGMGNITAISCRESSGAMTPDLECSVVFSDHSPVNLECDRYNGSCTIR